MHWVHDDWTLSFMEDSFDLYIYISQEEILGFSTTQIHYVFNEMGQSSLICKSRLVD
jgi:hypothetical protein